MSTPSDFPLKTALIALDMSEMDENLIRTVSFMHSLQRFEKLYIVHVTQRSRIPSSLKKEYPDLRSDKEILRKQIQESVSPFFEKDGPRLKIKILKGNVSREIISYANTKKTDLVITGRKKTLKGSGIALFRVTRGAHCSVLVVPEAPLINIKRVLLPVEFNETSRRAYYVAEHLAGETGNLSLFHLYHVPVGYTKTGKPYKEFDNIMLQNAQNDYSKFIKRIKMDSTPDVHFVNGDKYHAEDLILDYATAIKADILVMGSKSRSAPAYTLLGSVTEKVLHANENLPLLIVRKQNENMGFIELLKRI